MSSAARAAPTLPAAPPAVPSPELVPPGFPASPPWKVCPATPENHCAPFAAWPWGTPPANGQEPGAPAIGLDRVPRCRCASRADRVAKRVRRAPMAGGALGLFALNARAFCTERSRSRDRPENCFVWAFTQIKILRFFISVPRRMLRVPRSIRVSQKSEGG